MLNTHVLRKQVSSNRPNRQQLLVTPMRFIRTNATPTYYNQRFSPSTGIDQNYYHYYARFHGSTGKVEHKTEKDPTKFNYTNNLFSLDMQEWRSRGGDYFYQMFKGIKRSNDGYTRALVGYTSICYIMAQQALFWKFHLVMFSLFSFTRIRDRAVEPIIDEIFILDTIFKNKKISESFSPETYHVIDFDQNWDEGRDNPYFPEYRTSAAKFFNVDSNTTTGFYKMGDVETGAMMTLHFKTMPFANNRYNFSEPFYVYDMWAEITKDGEFTKEHIIKAEDVLKTKRIFVTWH